MSDDTAPPSSSAKVGPAATGPVSAAPRNRRTRRWIIALAVVAFLVVVVRPMVLETYTVPSASMEPVLRPGDHIAVLKHTQLKRGAVVVFVANDAFVIPGGGSGPLRSVGDFLGIRSETVYVKRIIGLPGDRVTVDHGGVLRINGVVATEPYLAAGTKASDQPFVATVPAGHYFVMGDNRAASDDSRNHLGDPGGGTVKASDIIGTVGWRYWPPSDMGKVEP
ncbi:signal peptidase I [Calidifontibacter terrae]